jgi:hypothetical protein
LITAKDGKMIEGSVQSPSKHSKQFDVSRIEFSIIDTRGKKLKVFIQGDN